MKHGEGGGKYFQSSDDKSMDLIFIFVLWIKNINLLADKRISLCAKVSPCF